MWTLDLTVETFSLCSIRFAFLILRSKSACCCLSSLLPGPRSGERPRRGGERRSISGIVSSTSLLAPRWTALISGNVRLALDELIEWV